ncbi:MAG TPA: hypothetical protein VI759_06325, partial [Dehalococcoidia bacterium]|nr:hypothetical protein [Dehalococcoidia bacterium]
MIILAEYGVALTLRFPMIKAGSQDFAGSGDWTPATGDTKLSKDGGNVANTTNNPAAVGGTGSKLWSLALTASEMQAAEVVVQIVDSATKAVEDQALIVQTYGNASARHKVNLNDPVRAGLTALPNAAAEAAGGLYTRGSGAGQLNQQDNGQVDANVERVRNSAINVLISGRVDANAGVVGDKTGYALTVADKDDVVDRVWDENVVAAHQGANAAGKTLTTRLTGGAGALQRTLGVTVGGNPLEGASVWVATDAGGTNIVAGPLVTSSGGVVTLLLDAGA